MIQIVSPYIALEWYDGPLLEIATVDFPEPRPDGVRERLIQVCALCTTHADEDSADRALGGHLGSVSFGEHPWTRAVIRLSRDDLQAMIDLYDGKPVKAYHDR